MAFVVNDLLIAAVAKMVDDAQADAYREPSHSDIEFYISRCGLSAGDPKALGLNVGKAKRVRQVMYYAMDENPEAAANFAEQIVARIRAAGGFRRGSPNHIGDEVIQQAIDAFDAVGCELGPDGSLSTKRLDSLRGKELTHALMQYALRAQRGAEDAALLSGTGKDLLEATAAHVIAVKSGMDSRQTNFPALLAQAFAALQLAMPGDSESNSELPQRSLERGLFAAAIGVNRLRNREGTGHGRPWVAKLSDAEAAAAVETAGVVSGYMLAKLNVG